MKLQCNASAEKNDEFDHVPGREAEVRGRKMRPMRELFEGTRATRLLCFHHAADAVERSAYSNQQESTWPEAAS